MATDGAIQRGREAFGERRWREAFESLTEADRSLALGGDDLMSLASAAYLVGEFDAHHRALERAHRRLADEGRTLRAARCAFLLGFNLVERGDHGAAAGWFARAQRMVEAQDGDCAERGWVLVPEIQRALSAGDYRGALTLAERVTELGERFHDADLTAWMLHARGLALLRMGYVSDGLALFDEAIVALTLGDLTPRMTGTLYCGVISACLQSFALQRADEWTAALDAWCADQPDLVPYAGQCRVYRAEVLQLRGAWEASLSEAREAEQRCRGGVDPRGVGAARYRQAEIHRLRGDLELAERCFRDAASAGTDPLPGLAWLRLTQGNAAAALAALRRALGEARQGARRARLLPGLVEVSLALGASTEAREAVEELETLAAGLESGVLEATASHLRGQVALAADDAQSALLSFRAASEAWRALDAPYEEARARQGVGLACSALGDLDGAGLELGAALDTFVRLGAGPDAALAKRELERIQYGGADAGVASPLTEREHQVLRCVANGDSNKAIAAALGISERTVERHLSNIFDKFGVNSRAAATAYAFEHQLF